METRPVRILLTDDDEDQFVIVERYLKRSRSGPYTVQWTSSFETALAAALEGGHDLCLLDYQLGDHTGIELLDEFRKRGIDMPIILLTGQSSYELDLNAMERGVSDFLDKNELNPVLLERSIRYTIENYRARIALKRMNDELEARVRERTAELNKSNQALERFAHMVAQELLAPVVLLEEQVLRALQREAAAGAEPSNVAHQLLDPVLHATQNVELLVMSILDHARAGREPAVREQLDLNEVVHTAWKRVEHRAESLGATMAVKELPVVLGSRRQLLGLFENMMDNALKYRGEAKTRIVVSAERQGDQWQIDVGDNGRGIDDGDSEDIFSMFNRLGADDTCEGAGIGLAICRKIVQHHGGRFWFDSEPGTGTTFHMLLPAAET